MIAYKVISQIRFNKSLINFTDLLEYDSEPLRIQFENLENGDIFRQYGMTNLLEGDFLHGTVLPSNGMKNWRRL